MPNVYVRQVLRKYLECDILAHGLPFLSFDRIVEYDDLSRSIFIIN